MLLVSLRSSRTRAIVADQVDVIDDVTVFVGFARWLTEEMGWYSSPFLFLSQSFLPVYLDRCSRHLTFYRANPACGADCVRERARQRTGKFDPCLTLNCSSPDDIH